MREASIDARTWWARPGLEVRDGRLTVAGRDAESLAREHGTPLYAHDLTRIGEQADALATAFGRAGLDGRVRLALKAQHEPGVLRYVRALDRVGIDVCSPREVEWALEHGWPEDEISYTGTNLSERDLDVILAHPDVHLNVDLITQIDRVGRRARGRTIGIRVNPRHGAGFEGGEHTLYSGPRPTKFGIFPERLEEALGVARAHDLTIDTVHCHVGDGYLSDELPTFEEVVRRVAARAKGRVTIIGSGGVMSAEDAYARIRAGATLVQVYTGFIYGGPGFAAQLQRGLCRLLARDGFATVQDAVGADLRS